jgi:hypothetical protein
MDQALQLAGAAMILAGFVLAQGEQLSPASRTYLALNLAGSAILAVLAFLDHQWGFFLLEGVWAIVSAISLGRICWSRCRVGRDSSAAVSKTAYDERGDPAR